MKKLSPEQQTEFNLIKIWRSIDCLYFMKLQAKFLKKHSLITIMLLFLSLSLTSCSEDKPVQINAVVLGVKGNTQCTLNGEIIPINLIFNPIKGDVISVYDGSKNKFYYVSLIVGSKTVYSSKNTYAVCKYTVE